MCTHNFADENDVLPADEEQAVPVLRVRVLVVYPLDGVLQHEVRCDQRGRSPCMESGARLGGSPNWSYERRTPCSFLPSRRMTSIFPAGVFRSVRGAGYFWADVLSTQSTSDPDVVNGINESMPRA